MDKIKLCDYGCGKEANHQLKNGKWCCSESYNQCLIPRKKQSIKIKKLYKDVNSKYNSLLYRENLKKVWSNPDSVFNSKEYREKLSKSNRLTIKKINKKYPFFSKIEEMRYNPDKLDEKEIQVHCKNHECKNSKEKGGWFTPTSKQIIDRKNNLDNEGEDKSYFYCCQHCKDTCPLYDLRDDPFHNPQRIKISYTPSEYRTFRTFVLERDKHICQFCGNPATDVHHERPQKLEPFFALDPDFGVACCEKCHYKYGHKDECSTGNLAKIVCSVESQKFLNQGTDLNE